MAVTFGVLMLVCGLLAITSPLYAGVSVTLFVGAYLLVGGISACVVACRAGAFGKGLVIFLIGAITALVGYYLLFQPLSGLAAITLVLAVYFLTTGIFELVAAFQARPAAGWAWLLVNAIVTFLLGLMIWRQFPLSGAWAVGILFGIKLILSGWWLMGVGRGLRSAAQQAAAQQSQRTTEQQ
ncbi:MAG: DUF308 domain-containing protein [Gammaproteobacteria bacterium]|nr:DUF308 domain-containing protein [Gammaproteobacteria bacterium]